MTETEADCDCGNFGEYQAACTHPILAALHQNEDTLKYISTVYTTKTYRAMYQEPLYPLSIKGLKQDITIKASRFVKQRGRPQSKRLGKGYEVKKCRCGNCGQMVNPNSRSCRSQPVAIQRRSAAAPGIQVPQAVNYLQAMWARRRNREWQREVKILQLAVEEAEGEEAVRLAAQLQELDPTAETEPEDEEAEMDEILESIIAKGAEAGFGPTRDEFGSVASRLRIRKRGAEA